MSLAATHLIQYVHCCACLQHVLDCLHPACCCGHVQRICIPLCMHRQGG